MESTFKKEYEVQYLADGSMQLTYQEKRVGAHAAGPTTFLLTILFLFFGFWAVVLPTWGIVSIVGDENWGTIACVIAVCVFVGGFTLIRKILVTTSQIVATKEGLIFQGMQLAYKDLTNIGVNVQSTSGAGNMTTAYIFAEGGGKQFKVTKHVKPALAKALHNEMDRYVLNLQQE